MPNSNWQHRRLKFPVLATSDLLSRHLSGADFYDSAGNHAAVLELFWSRNTNNPELDHLTDAEILAAGTFVKQHDVWYTVTLHAALLHLVLHLVHE